MDPKDVTTNCLCGATGPSEGNTTGGSPTAMKVLMDEHRVIERVLDALERKLEDDACIDRAFVTDALDFFRNFADGCHHHKEEGELFPALETAGVRRDGGPIGCMLHEHEGGRRLVHRIADHLDAAAQDDPKAVATVRTAAADYIGMLRFHIEKEDTILFRMAEQVLSESQQQDILESFRRAEHCGGDTGRHERYIRLAESLYRQAFGQAT